MAVLEHPLELRVEGVLGGLHVRQKQPVEELRHLVDARSKVGDGSDTDEVADGGHGVHVAHQSIVMLERDLGQACGHVRLLAGSVAVIDVMSLPLTPPP